MYISIFLLQKQLEYKYYLDNDRFTTVGYFNGQLQVGIWQYQKSEYDASKLFPTVTGISLLEEEWKPLTNNCDTVSEAVKKNTTTSHHLVKYIGISHYSDKGPINISIRQHYTFDDGVSRPTKKAINLKRKEWEPLVSVIDLVDEAVNNLKSEFTYDRKTIVKSVCVYFTEQKCYQYDIVETGEVFYSPIEE